MQIMNRIWRFTILILLILPGSSSYCVGGRSSVSCSGWGPADLNSGSNLNLTILPNSSPSPKPNPRSPLKTKTRISTDFVGNPRITSLRIEGKWWTPTWDVVDSFFPNLEVIILNKHTQSVDHTQSCHFYWSLVQC